MRSTTTESADGQIYCRQRRFHPVRGNPLPTRTGRGTCGRADSHPLGSKGAQRTPVAYLYLHYRPGYALQAAKKDDTFIC